MFALILYFLPLAGLAVVLALALAGRRKRKRDGRKNTALAVNETMRAALLDCYRELKKDGAGCGPWLSSCIVRMNAGAGVPVPVALMALELTADELRGRHDLGPIWRAWDVISEL